MAGSPRELSVRHEWPIELSERAELLVRLWVARGRLSAVALLVAEPRSKGLGQASLPWLCSTEAAWS